MAPLRFFSENPTIQNYFSVWESTPIMTYFKNTFIMVIVCVPFQLLFASTSAFAFTFYEFKGKEFLFTLFLTTMMIPGEVTLISNYATIQNMGLYNTYAAITITSLVNVSATFMLRQHMRSLPKELWEAAKMDGASSWQILRKITIPQIMPSITICLFLSLTNAFKLFDQNLALTAGAPNKKTEMLALNIYNAFYSNATNLGIGQAKAVIFFLLVVLISLTQLSLTRKKEAQL